MADKQLSLMDVIGVNTGKTDEDEAIEKTTHNDEERACPYNKCTGNGIIRKKDNNGNIYADFCECYFERVFTQKLKNANISPDYLNKDFDFDDGNTIITLLKPKSKVVPIKPKKKNQSIEEALLEEETEDFIKRNYELKKEKRKPGEIFKSYSEKNLALLNSGKKTANLLLFGGPGNGKTTFACLIGRYFLLNDKKVYFSTTEDFLNAIIDKHIDVKKISKQYDVLILDELFNEYHTDSEYAKKKLKEILKIREENKLITICTSNGNPKEFSLLYGDSIMSLINGTFFLFHLERETDGRIDNIYSMYDNFGF